MADLDLPKRLRETAAITQLRINPKEFLTRNAVVPYAISDKETSFDNEKIRDRPGTYLFYMADDQRAVDRPGTILGSHRIHKKGAQKFRILHKPTFGGTVFQAVHIPVQPSTLYVNLEQSPVKVYPLPTQGADIMITTQLSGCSFVMLAGDGTWSVAHLQPIKEEGAQLQERLEGAGYKVYGANNLSGGGKIGRASVIGVRNKLTWKFYAQLQDVRSNVLSVKKI